MLVDNGRGKDEAPAAATLYMLHYKQKSEAKANMTPSPDSSVTCGLNWFLGCCPKQTQSHKVWKRTGANRANQYVCVPVIHSLGLRKMPPKSVLQWHWTCSNVHSVLLIKIPR